jgi:hypothetical protein
MGVMPLPITELVFASKLMGISGVLSCKTNYSCAMHLSVCTYDRHTRLCRLTVEQTQNREAHQQGPGATQLMRMPKSDISAVAAPFVNAAIAALVVA